MYFFGKFCCLCLKTNCQFYEINKAENDGILIINKLLTVLPIYKNFPLETLPNWICNNCKIQINRSYNFYKSCLNNYQTLIKYKTKLTTCRTFQLNNKNNSASNHLKQEIVTNGFDAANEEIQRHNDDEDNEKVEEVIDNADDDEENEEVIDIEDDEQIEIDDEEEENGIFNEDHDDKEKEEEGRFEREDDDDDDEDVINIDEETTIKENIVRKIVKHDLTVNKSVASEIFSIIDQIVENNRNFNKEQQEIFTSFPQNFNVKLKNNWKLVIFRDKQFDKLTIIKDSIVNTISVYKLKQQKEEDLFILKHKLESTEENTAEKILKKIVEICKTNCLNNSNEEIEKKLIKCGVCRKAFKTYNELKIHKEEHADLANKFCRICDRYFVDLIDLYLHLKTHSISSTKQLDVDNISLHSDSSSSFKFHLSDDNDDFDKDTVILSNLDNFNDFEETRINLDDDDDSEPEDKKLKFDQIPNQNILIELKTNNKTIKNNKFMISPNCSTCGLSFKFANNFYYHLKKYHKCEIFPCIKCEKELPTLKGILRHLKIHKSAKRRTK